MADISKITLPSGTTYNLKDTWAREQISKIISGGIKFIGVSSTVITDGGREKPTINNEVVTPSKGDLVLYTYVDSQTHAPGTYEFLFDSDYVSASSGGKWQELGESSIYGALAYKDSATGNFTPSGSVSGGAFTGSSTTFTGTYTPEGTVTAPTISVSSAGSTDTIKNPTSVTVAKSVDVAAPGATAPSHNLTYYAVDSSTETLSLYQIGYTTGDSITTTNITVKTGDASYSASTPTFSGTEATISTSGTPQGNNSALGFTGTQGTVTVS